MKLYTGCPNHQIFLFILHKVKPKVSQLQFHKGKITSNIINATKNYQKSPTRPGCRGKPGPRSDLNTENQLLFTLHVEDLSFRFGLCKKIFFSYYFNLDPISWSGTTTSNLLANSGRDP